MAPKSFRRIVWIQLLVVLLYPLLLRAGPSQGDARSFMAAIRASLKNVNNHIIMGGSSND